MNPVLRERLLFSFLINGKPMTNIIERKGNNNGRKKENEKWPRLRWGVTLLVLFLIASNWFTGSSCVVKIGSFSINCPLGVVQVISAAGKVLPIFLIGGLFGIILITIFGRAFCSWVCPARFVLGNNPKSKKLTSKQSKVLQGAVFGGVVGLSYVCHTPVFCPICPVGVVCRGAVAAGTGGSILPAVGWMGVLVGVEKLSTVSWCKDLCPLGTLIKFFSRFNPFLQVKANEKCVPCKACEMVCPENINLSHGADMSDCSKCFNCQSVCPREAVDILLVDVK